MLPSVYLETSVVSYLVAHPSRDLVVAGRQQATRDWGRMAAQQYTLVASDLVVDEAGAGNAHGVRARMAVLNSVMVLDTTAAVIALVDELLSQGALPRKAAADATHIAIAAVNRTNYLVTWNFKHIANPVQLPRINRAYRALNHRPAVICTPAALMEVPYEKPTGGPDFG